MRGAATSPVCDGSNGQIEGQKDDSEEDEQTTMERQRAEGGREGAADLGDAGSARNSRSSVSLRPPDWTQLVPLRTKKDVKRFLRTIHKQFLDNVDIQMSGLQDELIAQKVLIDSDVESLRGLHYPTRREKARRLWHILFTINHGTFITKVLPPFCQHYGYIIPERCWLPGNASWVPETSGSWVEAEHPDCTRCSIRERISPAEVGDILIEAALVTPDEYRNIYHRYRTSSTDWPKIFDPFKKLAGRDVTSHVIRMRRLIARHSLPVPENLYELLTSGFPCTCPPHRTQSRQYRSVSVAVTATSTSESSLPSLQSSWPSLQCSTPSLQCSTPSLQCSTPSLQCSTSSLQCSTPSLQCSTPSLHCSTPSLQYSLPPLSPTPSHSLSSDIHQQNDDDETALKEVVSVGTLTRPSTTEGDSSDGESGRKSTQVGGEHIALEQAEAVHGLTAQGESASPPEVEEKIAESCFEESVYYETDQTSLSELTVTKTAWRKSSLMSSTQEIKQRACTGRLKDEQRDCTEGNSGHYTPHTKSEVTELHDPSLLEPFVPKGNTKPETSDPVGDATESPRRDACVVIISPEEQQNERQNTRSVDDHPAQLDNYSDASVTNVKTRVFAWGGNKSCATFCLKLGSVAVFVLFCLVVFFCFLYFGCRNLCATSEAVHPRRSSRHPVHSHSPVGPAATPAPAIHREQSISSRQEATTGGDTTLLPSHFGGVQWRLF